MNYTMTTLLIILTLVALAFLLPKTAFMFKVVVELLIIAFYAVALAIIAIITIRSYTDSGNADSVQSKEGGNLNQAS